MRSSTLTALTLSTLLYFAPVYGEICGFTGPLKRHDTAYRAREFIGIRDETLVIVLDVVYREGFGEATASPWAMVGILDREAVPKDYRIAWTQGVNLVPPTGRDWAVERDVYHISPTRGPVFLFAKPKTSSRKILAFGRDAKPQVHILERTESSEWYKVEAFPKPKRVPYYPFRKPKKPRVGWVEAKYFTKWSREIREREIESENQRARARHEENEARWRAKNHSWITVCKNAPNDVTKVTSECCYALGGSVKFDDCVVKEGTREKFMRGVWGLAPSPPRDKRLCRWERD